MFGNWHNGIEVKTKARICIDVPLYVGPYESVVITLFLTRLAL
jgi:hypothetical protein